MTALLTHRNPRRPKAAIPKRISGLAAWYDASQITGKVDGDKLSSWIDASGVGANLAQATGAAQPTYKTNIINSLPVARFAGAQWMQATFTLNVPAHVFVVVPSTTWVSGAALVDGKNDLTMLLQQVTSSPKYRVFSNGTATTAADAPAMPVVATYEFQASGSASTYLLRMNGTQIANIASGSPSAAGGVTIGARGAGSSLFYTGDIAEVIVFNRALSAQEQAEIEHYLGTKYGITVA